MNDKKTTVDNLKEFVKNFVDERDWEQFSKINSGSQNREKIQMSHQKAYHCTNT